MRPLSRVALTTKSTFTVTTWWTRPVDRPTSTIWAIRSTASPIVTSSMGTPMMTADVDCSPLMSSPRLGPYGPRPPVDGR